MNKEKLLLTDEEIDAMDCESSQSCASCPLNYKDRACCGFEDKVAKAQLDKVMTWLFEPCTEHIIDICLQKPQHDIYANHRYLCPECMKGVEHE